MSLAQPVIIPWDERTAHRHATGFLHPFVNEKMGAQQLRLHVSVINPGEAPHAPHQHAGEEIIFLLEGTAEALVGNDWKRFEAPSAVFCPEHIMHGVRNAGETPLKYLVIRVPEGARANS
ncbi:MAG: cupin domain-containing protein [Opitutaceae bacterium]